MFETKFDRPMWRIIYEDLLVKCDIGDVVTYEQMRAVLPEVSEMGIRQAYFRALREIQVEKRRTFANVRNVGYRMVEAAEHERLARAHHKRGKRQIKKAIDKVRSADRSRLSHEDRARFDAMEATLGRHSEMIDRLDGRVARQEKALRDARRQAAEEVAAAREQASTEVSAVETRLSKLEEALQRAGIASSS